MGHLKKLAWVGERVCVMAWKTSLEILMGTMWDKSICGSKADSLGHLMGSMKAF